METFSRTDLVTQTFQVLQARRNRRLVIEKFEDVESGLTGLPAELTSARSKF
jgi:hypothetical protein